MHKHHYGILLMLTQIYYVFDKSYSQLVMVKKTILFVSWIKMSQKSRKHYLIKLIYANILHLSYNCKIKFIFNFRTTLRFKQITKKNTEKLQERFIWNQTHNVFYSAYTKIQVSEIKTVLYPNESMSFDHKWSRRKFFT